MTEIRGADLHDLLRSKDERIEELEALLGEALTAFVPNHDMANALAVKVGLGDLPNAELVARIRSALHPSEPRPTSDLPPMGYPLHPSEPEGAEAQMTPEQEQYAQALAEWRAQNVVQAQAVKPVNHALHIILTILTAGAWLVVYVPILIVHGHRAKRAYRATT